MKDKTTGDKLLHKDRHLSDLLNLLYLNHPKRIDLSLSRIKRLLKELKNPEKSLAPVIHIAGTNGKGSVASFLSSILKQSGKKVHLYTSPHLVSFNERIQISGKNISNNNLKKTLSYVYQINQNKKITFFELITAATFVVFSKYHADLVILETGLGGRLDATNVISKPIISIITPISSDHTEFLGSSISAITKEKAGIIKKNVPIISGKQTSTASNIIKNTAKFFNAKLYAQNYDWKRKENFLIYQKTRINLSKCGLLGDHQLDNAALAAMCCLINPKLHTNKLNIDKGIEKAKWPGRIEKLKGSIATKFSNLDIWLDAAHNLSGIKSLLRWASKVKINNIFIIVLGKNKSALNILKEINKIKPSKLIFISLEGSEFYSPSKLMIISKELGIKASLNNNIIEALNYCSSLKSKNRIIITGSIYFIGKVLSLNEKIKN